MLIASKYEEMYAPEIADFVYITDNAYSKSDIRRMECLMLKTLDFNLGRPLPLHFLRRNSKAGEVRTSFPKFLGHACTCASVCFHLLFRAECRLHALVLCLKMSGFGIVLCFQTYWKNLWKRLVGLFCRAPVELNKDPTKEVSYLLLPSLPSNIVSIIFISHHSNSIWILCDQLTNCWLSDFVENETEFSQSDLRNQRNPLRGGATVHVPGCFGP